MLDYTSRALLVIKGDHMQIPSSWWQIFEKLRRVKVLMIALSLKDIELGLKSPKEAFLPLICNQ